MKTLKEQIQSLPPKRQEAIRKRAIQLVQQRLEILKAKRNES